MIADREDMGDVKAADCQIFRYTDVNQRFTQYIGLSILSYDWTQMLTVHSSSKHWFWVAKSIDYVSRDQFYEFKLYQIIF